MVFLHDLSISGQVFTEIVGAFFLFITTIIIGFRYNFRKNSKKLIDKPKSDNYLIKKYEEVDVFKHSRSFFQVGLVCSLGIVAMAFQWTTFENVSPETFVHIELDEEVPVIRTPRQEKPIPIPPPPISRTITHVIKEIESESAVNFVPLEVQPIKVPKNTKIIAQKKPKKPIPQVEIIEFIEPEVDEIIDIVEQMPLFSSNCLDEKDKNQCSSSKLMQFIYKKIKYPSLAREVGIHGTVVIQFIVEKNGSISSPKIVREIGGGCGEEALRVVKLMEKWLPGKQRGKEVRVRFNLPVKFQLQ